MHCSKGFNYQLVTDNTGNGGGVLPPLQQIFITKLDNIELGKVVSASSPGPVTSSEPVS